MSEQENREQEERRGGAETNVNTEGGDANIETGGAEESDEAGEETDE